MGLLTGEGSRSVRRGADFPSERQENREATVTGTNDMPLSVLVTSLQLFLLNNGAESSTAALPRDVQNSGPCSQMTKKLKKLCRNLGNLLLSLF